MMKLSEIYEHSDPKHWVIWRQDGFSALPSKPTHKMENREMLARMYVHMCRKLEDRGATVPSSTCRKLWNETLLSPVAKDLPKVISQDCFLCFYALGKPMRIFQFRKLFDAIESGDLASDLPPLEVKWNARAELFYDADATPPGVMAKLFVSSRLKKDVTILKQIASDLSHLADIPENRTRERLTMAILSHAAAYRELEGRVLHVPSTIEAGKMIPYICAQHMIAHGVKTVSLRPVFDQERVPGIYLCQGTELWPSQPSVLGSISANLAYHGSATDAYAHSWRRIHKHLRDLRVEEGPAPLVGGHSMGGAMGMQIAMYSHDLIEKIYAFNPPMTGKRDSDFYQTLPEEIAQKMVVSANLDDFAFWRIGERVVGQVSLYLGKKRWRYLTVNLWDCLFILPAFVKFMLNVRHSFPAHQNITALYDQFVHFKLSPQEVQVENTDRLKRFDYLHFLPKLYDPAKLFIKFIRKIFGWAFEKEYMLNEIEIISLHERELIDTITEENREEIERELSQLRLQKERLLKHWTAGH